MLQGNKPLIVVAHHPVFVKDPKEGETYENFPVHLREKYLSLFKKCGVDVYLAGHLHKCAQAEYDGIRFITASALGRQLGKDSSGYTVVKIENGVANVNYNSIN
jgi:predicted phosphodiesterase